MTEFILPKLPFNQLVYDDSERFNYVWNIFVTLFLVSALLKKIYSS